MATAKFKLVWTVNHAISFIQNFEPDQKCKIQFLNVDSLKLLNDFFFELELLF